MPDLILYNYALSPFSEKIRVMLGITGCGSLLNWRESLGCKVTRR